MFKKRLVKGTSQKRRRPEGDEDHPASKRPTTEENGDLGKVFKKVNDGGEPNHQTDEPVKAISSSNIEASPEATNNKELESLTVSDTGPTDGTKSNGLKLMPQNIRTTTITDFQPDVCKDFLKTGYCGYGDTCKFLHIRDELRQKVPIRKEWETVQTKKKAVEPLPFKCVLCKNDYTSPIKTVCGHLFCRKCFMDRYKKGKTKCFICLRETSGTVQPVNPRELERLLAA